MATGLKISDEDLRSEVLINPKLNRTNQYICDCPFCGKESHFYIDKTSQLFDCKKCGESGNIYKLLRFVDKLYLLQGSTVEARETIASVRSILEEEREQDDTESAEVLPVIPGGASSRQEVRISADVELPPRKQYDMRLGLHICLKSIAITFLCRFAMAVRYGDLLGGTQHVEYQRENYVTITAWEQNLVVCYLAMMRLLPE